MTQAEIERVRIVHNPVPPGADPSTADVLDEAHLVEEALRELDIAVERVPLEPAALWSVPLSPGELLFNLIESPPSAPLLQLLAAATLELRGAVFTGSSAHALWLTTDKLATRALLAAEGVSVAPGGVLEPDRPEVLSRVPPPWILKPGLEDASVGLDLSAFVSSPETAIARGRDLRARFPGQPLVLEHYLPGREFNVGVLEVDGAPVVLPVAEMTFVDYPDDLPRIVGYEAKWVEGHVAYEGTRRAFPDDVVEAALLERLRRTAVRAWALTGVSGYARVDMRLDESGVPCVLEVNANPCLSPEAGLIVASERSGLSRADVVRRILDAALRRAERSRGAAPREGAC